MGNHFGKESNDKKRNPLVQAIEEDNNELAISLIEKAQKSLPKASYLEDFDCESDMTPLHMAISMSNKFIVDKLIEAKIKLNANIRCSFYFVENDKLTMIQKEILYSLIKNGLDLYSCGTRASITPFCQAVYYGNTELMNILIENDLDIEHDKQINDSSGYPLLRAAIDDETGSANALTMLINLKKLDLEQPFKIGYVWYTVLDYATEKKHLSAIGVLLEAGVKINDPERLANFLLACDQREPSVLIGLLTLCRQLHGNDDPKFKELKTYTAKLTEMGEAAVAKEISSLEQKPDKNNKLVSDLASDLIVDESNYVLTPDVVKIIAEYLANNDSIQSALLPIFPGKEPLTSQTLFAFFPSSKEEKKNGCNDKKNKFSY